MANLDHNMNEELLGLLRGLIRSWEHEVVEFKEASNDYDNDKIGRYFSAISNEANLKGLQHGWLVFGVHNKTREIVNSNYREKRGLETLKYEIAQNTTGGITFTDIFEVFDGDKRVVMFKIPAAVSAIPTAWKGHWYGRDGESLGPLSQEELDRMRGKVRRDWSKQLIERSGVRHLDTNAIRIARENYKNKQNREHISTEIDKMSDEEFLTKIRLIEDGKLTNAAMVLLGNPDYENLMDGHARLMWRLYGSNGMVKDYEAFNIPYITVVDRAHDKIRNLVYRYLPNRKTLFTTETQQYDASLLKELLNNCVAHMDYTTGGRIYLDEFEDMVVISNPGSFIPGDVRKVLEAGYRAPYYRNQLLSDAMRDFDMIDTVQMGILRVFNIQRDRYFPLPDYNLEEANEVSVRVYGKILDENYTRLLFDRGNLSIDTVFLLDRVQKKLPIEKGQYKFLKNLGLIEGKMPHVYVSLSIAEAINEKEQYTKNKAMDDKYYMDLIINYLNHWKIGRKSDFIKLLGDKLPDILDEKQKETKVRSLIRVLQKSKLVERTSDNKRTGAWRLAQKQ